MIDQVYNYMTEHNMVRSGGRILAAVSGGADSMCLLEVLRLLGRRMGYELRVFHVHHGLRESAEGDLSYVRHFCGDAGIPFEAARVDAAGFAEQNGLSLEEGARGLRYRELERAAQEWDDEACAVGLKPAPCRIAVAHHVEDQAETVLFNLVRGSRLTGMRGMLPVNGRIIRPLLGVRRAEIEEFLTERGIGWRHDETNDDTTYARNLLRRDVMPILQTVNSGACGHIARTAEEAAETEEFLARQTRRALQRCLRSPSDLPPTAGEGQLCAPDFTMTAGDGASDRAALAADRTASVILDIPAILSEEPLIRRRVIYAAAAGVMGTKKDLQNVHVMDVLRIASSEGNGKVSLPGRVTAEKIYDELCIYGPKGPVPEGSAGAVATGTKKIRSWPGSDEDYSCRLLSFDGDMSAVPRNLCTKWFDYDKIGTFPVFRTRREGDRMTIDADGRSKTVARIMIDGKVPAHMRDRIVLPAAGGEILWFPGGRISAAFMVDPSTVRVLEIKLEPDIL